MRKHLLFHFILFAALLCSSVFVYAQTGDTLVYQLNEAQVNAVRRVGVSPMQRYGVGGTTYRADSTTLSLLRHTSLADYITQLTPMYIRETGNGMMASGSLRGTSSAHTVVEWNGINVNSLTMGQTDFNHLPIFFFDKVEVYPGGEGALYGNGSIGGNIQLKTELDGKEPLCVDIQQSLSSFSTTFTAGKLVVNRKKWSTKTAALYNVSKNDFTFRNSTVYGFPREHQNNASYNRFGVLQEVCYRPSDRANLSLKTWYMGFYREIQPMMSLNNTPSSFDTIRDKSLVTLINYNQSANWGQLSLSGGYLYDRQLFRNDVVAINRYIARAEAEKYLLTKISVKAGAYTEYIVPDVNAYQSGITEWRSDVYVLLHYNITSRLEASVNLRQSFVSKLSVPFTPSAGIAYRLIDNHHHQFKLRSTVSKSFRAPTLNDRYWGKSGNIDLMSETGINIEAGADYWLNTSIATLQIQTTLYRNEVDNWIQWQPRGNIWKPLNLRKVEVKGVEAGFKLETNIDKANITLGGNYVYVNSCIKKGINATDPNMGLPLPLLPKHRGSASVDASYSKIFMQFVLSYTGETYSTDRSEEMKIDDYLLAHVSGGYTFNFKHTQQKLTLLARVDNVFDKDYQNVKFFAMPGRNWLVSLRYTL